MDLYRLTTEKAMKLDELAKISPQKHGEAQQSTSWLSFTEVWNTNREKKERIPLP
jgi:hypothetical protein